MERKLASVQKILKLEPIEGADAIERATILGWSVVAKKGEFKEGDRCIYFEIDSLLPVRPEFGFLAKGGVKKTLVDGQEVTGYRLRTIKLRGQISQGLALPVKAFEKDLGISTEELEEGADVTSMLGVVKYEPPIPANLSGKVKGPRPGFIPKTDEPRIQTIPQMLERYRDVRFVVTEKLDGSSVSVYYKDGQFGVCSRNLELLRDEDNTIWKVVMAADLEKKLKEYGKDMALQGEIVGEGIQTNPLKIKGQKIYFFNAYDMAKNEYLDYPDFIATIDRLGLERVPVMMNDFQLPDTVEHLVNLVSSLKSTINPGARLEGIVVRPVAEKRDVEIGRLSFKVVNPLYLLESEG